MDHPEEFLLKGHLGFGKFRHQFQSHLGCSLAPAVLLQLEIIQFLGYFRRGAQVHQVTALPPGKLGSEGHIHVFGHCVPLPSAHGLNGCHAPDAARTIKTHHQPGGGPGGLFHYEVSIQGQPGHPGDHICREVNMVPAGLYKTNLGIVEEWDRAFQPVPRRYEISVEDGCELPFCVFQTEGEIARFKTVAVFAVEVFDIHALPAVFFHKPDQQVGRPIRGIIQHLDLQFFRGVIKLSNSFKDPFRQVSFIVDRQLNRHVRPFCRRFRGSQRPDFFPIADIDDHADEEIHPDQE